jgi:hypothetical protein
VVRTRTAVGSAGSLTAFKYRGYITIGFRCIGTPSILCFAWRLWVYPRFHKVCFNAHGGIWRSEPGWFWWVFLMFVPTIPVCITLFFKPGLTTGWRFNQSFSSFYLGLRLVLTVDAMLTG